MKPLHERLQICLSLKLQLEDAGENWGSHTPGFLLFELQKGWLRHLLHTYEIKWTTRGFQQSAHVPAAFSSLADKCKKRICLNYRHPVIEFSTRLITHVQRDTRRVWCNLTLEMEQRCLQRETKPSVWHRRRTTCIKTKERQKLKSVNNMKRGRIQWEKMVNLLLKFNFIHACSFIEISFRMKWERTFSQRKRRVDDVLICRFTMANDKLRVGELAQFASSPNKANRTRLEYDLRNVSFR